jgi:hypothetical protein
MHRKPRLSGLRREITLILGTTVLSACVVLVSIAVSKYKQQATGYAFINGHLVYVTTPPPDPSTLPEVAAEIKARERRMLQLRQWAMRNGVQLRDKDKTLVSPVDFLSFSNDSRVLASNHQMAWFVSGMCSAASFCAVLTAYAVLFFLQTDESWLVCGAAVPLIYAAREQGVCFALCGGATNYRKSKGRWQPTTKRIGYTLREAPLFVLWPFLLMEKL